LSLLPSEFRTTQKSDGESTVQRVRDIASMQTAKRNISQSRDWAAMISLYQSAKTFELFRKFRILTLSLPQITQSRPVRG